MLYFHCWWWCIWFLLVPLPPRGGVLRLAGASARFEGTPFSRRNNTIAYFFHLHKAGGHSVCRLARQHNESCNGKANCNVYRLGLNTKNEGYPGKSTCCGATLAEQAEFASTSQWSFVANERDLPPVLDKEHYRYMTVFRDPVQRHVSNYLFSNNPSQVSEDHFRKWLQHQADNFMLRKVCGLRCRVPRGELTTAHMAIAREMLDQFDVVVVLDDLLSNFEAMGPVMNDVLGWDDNNAPHSQAHTQHTQKTPNLLDIGRGAEFKVMMTWDNELYAYAKLLAAKQKAALLGSSNAAVFGDGSDRVNSATKQWELARENEESTGIRFEYSQLAGKCANSCCGTCSKANLDLEYIPP